MTTTFPIVPVPDPPGDSFEEPVCEVCGGAGYVETGVVEQGHIEYLQCDCQREEEDG